MPNETTIERAKAARDKLLDKVGFGRGGPCNGAAIGQVRGRVGIRALLSRQPDNPLPDEIDGIPVEWVEVGQISVMGDQHVPE